jgi:UDP-N-acetylglucosamine--N-acetylmuramyl-(pentapeptide) pyrophosphoryl-undecaprenol N-acetylglucosamine transferase
MTQGETSQTDIGVVLVAAGGTGGHIYPGLAVARALRQRGARPIVVGTPKGLESSLVPPAGFELRLLPAISLSKSPKNLVVLPINALRAVLGAINLIRETRPVSVIGMGGYASVALIIAAKLCRVPAIVHESGAVAGRANKLCVLLTRRAAVSFERVRSDLSSKAQLTTTGMPLWVRVDAAETPVRPHDPFTVLATGGSQGSMVVNRLAVDLARHWRSDPRIRIVLKTGKQHRSTVDQLIANETLPNLELVDYFDSISAAYALSDAVVTRAGAGTVAELETVGLPAVFLPYPYAPDDHQARNAEVLTDRGAAILVRDDDATAATVAPWIEGLLNDSAAYQNAQKAATNDVHQRAALAVADLVLGLAR